VKLLLKFLKKFYAISQAMGIFIETYGTSKVNLTDGEIAKKVEAILICVLLFKSNAWKSNL
jgi:hypothetical protein